MFHNIDLLKDRLIAALELELIPILHSPFYNAGNNP